jgi:hypothetical protein
MKILQLCKINAILNSGQRIKDFIDIHYLLKDMSLDDMMKYYYAKYPDVNLNVAKSSLLYYNDIDLTFPVLLKNRKLKWPSVQRSISKAIQGYNGLQVHRVAP